VKSFQQWRWQGPGVINPGLRFGGRVGERPHGSSRDHGRGEGDPEPCGSDGRVPRRPCGTRRRSLGCLTRHEGADALASFLDLEEVAVLLPVKLHKLLSSTLVSAGVSTGPGNLTGRTTGSCHLSTPPSPTLGVEVPGVPGIARCRPVVELHRCYTPFPVDLSSGAAVEVDCERCGRPYGTFTVGRSGLSMRLKATQSPITRGPRTGRHQVRMVVGQEPFNQRFECGCGHVRTIGLSALKRKLQQAPEPRIRI
jgi:hypothetical protein